MVYVFSDPEQIAAGPVIVPGLASVVITFTVIVRALLCPQPFTAFTVSVPPLPFVEVVMLLVVLLPVHPEGRVHR